MTSNYSQWQWLSQGSHYTIWEKGKVEDISPNADEKPLYHLLSPLRAKIGRTIAAPVEFREDRGALKPHDAGAEFHYIFLSWCKIFATPWTAAGQASLSFTISWSLLKFMSFESLTPSSHLIFCPPSYSSCPQSFPASGSFPVHQFFASGGQRIGASASVLPMNIQGWFLLGLTGLISLQYKGLSRVPSYGGESIYWLWIYHTSPCHRAICDQATGACGLKPMLRTAADGSGILQPQRHLLCQPAAQSV